MDATGKDLTMGCFCRNLIPSPSVPGPDLDLSARLAPPPAVPAFPLLEAVSAHLSARWQPAEPWVPDPAWLQVAWPTVQLPAASLGVLVSLFGALDSVRLTFGLDLENPAHVQQLVRIVATLNARAALLAELDGDRRPWSSLLQLMMHVELVERAARLNLFAAVPGIQAGARLDVRPWKPVLMHVKALAPLVVIGQQLKLDWTDPDAAVARIAAVLRVLARVRLPALLDAPLVLRLAARFDALARLKLGLGADPTPHAFARVRLALERRAELALRLLPPHIRLEAGVLLGMPHLDINMGLVLTPATVAQARLITPGILARLNWTVPGFDSLPLLTVGLPVTHLVTAMAKLDLDPVRGTPCAAACDAAQVMRALPPLPAPPPTTPPGSGTGAARAG